MIKIITALFFNDIFYSTLLPANEAAWDWFLLFIEWGLVGVGFEEDVYGFSSLFLGIIGDDCSVYDF